MNPDYDFERVAAILVRQKNKPGALLPILHDVQAALGFIPPECVAQIATALNLSRAEVHGVITFYHHFRSTPPARHSIQICCAEACQSMGAERLTQHAEKHLADCTTSEIDMHPVYCLGLCATSPAMMIDDELHARVTPAKFDKLMKKIGSAT